MNDKALKVLEFDKIRQRLEGFMECGLGKERAMELKPYSQIEKVKELLQETDEAKRLLDMDKDVPFGGISDIREALVHAQKGLVLSPPDLLAVLYTVSGARRIRKSLSEIDGNEFPLLRDIGSRMGQFTVLERLISEAISDSGEVMDSASPALRLLRNKVKTLNNRIKDVLDHMVRSSDTSKHLQESLVSMRNGRFVIPVKAEFKNQVPGIIHDQSASGATVFIEPMGVVEANNDLRQAMAAEETEVARILAELTNRVAEFADSVNDTVNCLAQLDFIFGRAKMAQEMNATCPTLNTSGRMSLKNARHPLLKGDVVPISPYIGQGFDTLVITGPNTGGKTVTLKTIGLMTLMVQAGLHIPVDPGSEVAVFENVFADIGDEQSIEQSLSTFSSHLKNIVEILEEVNERSLVLLDELGAGTDPQEGAAIAMAVLSHLHSVGARTVATTHYSELKVFAHTTQGIKNASVEFNVDTLKPTYRLSIGVPGSSNAFAIAKRLGLSEDILDRANGLLDVKDARVEEMINSLKDEFDSAKIARQDAEALRNRYLELKDKYENSVDKAREERSEMLRKARYQAEDVIRDAREQINALLSDLRSKEMSSNEAQNLARKRVEELKKASEKAFAGQIDDTAFEDDGEEDVDLKVGDEVEVRGFSTQVGQILEFTSRDTAVVAIGSAKVTVKRSSLKRAPKRSKMKVERSRSSIDKALDQRSPYSFAKLSDSENAAQSRYELDLRGKRVEEALNDVDKFIDEAVLAGTSSARIIHGKGTGALREAIKTMMIMDARVKSSRLGDPGEGGDGVTIVKFSE